ncbi:MAG: universal stress protein [Nitrococcus mobilis]|nr:universal stress protein [Nitrococcus mobilis]
MFEPKVLFATDLEGDLGRGLHLATDLALKHAATLLLLHVVPYHASDGEALLHRVLDASMRRPDQILAGLTPTDAAVPYRHILETGEPEDRILEVAERERVDRILLEVQPRSALRRMLGRSTVERIMARAPCPVVTYRAPGPSTGPVATPPPKLHHADVPFQALQVMLAARVDALEWWLSVQRNAVQTVANRLGVQDGAAGLVASGPRSLGPAQRARTQRLLELELGEFGRAIGAIGVYLLDPSEQALVGYGVKPDPSEVCTRFLASARKQDAAVSIPMTATSNGPRSGGVILGAAKVPVRGTADVLLVYVFDARKDFLRILAQPGPAPSAETYAFDEHGIMLSNSRFPDQLRHLGLLPPDKMVQTPHLLRVCDPGGNLLTGYHPTLSKEQCPLTVMAAQATAGQNGFDNRGYRDYRGVEVVGTWRWLDAYGFGVAAEMDRPIG